MRVNKIRNLMLGLLLCILLASCELPGANLPATQNATAIFNQVAETVNAFSTQQALLATATPLPTHTSEPSNTPVPSNSPTKDQTEEAAPLEETPSISSTPSPTMSSPTITSTPLPGSTGGDGGASAGGSTNPTTTSIASTSSCNRAELVLDVTVLDNTAFAPETAFTKTWRLKNVGTCTWTTEYDLVFVKGDQMDAKDNIALSEEVAPGETIDVSASMRAPKDKGSYRGDWMLSNASGDEFGVGSGGNQTFWVDIRVTDIGDERLVYDFSANYCKANWESAEGDLPCPGTSSSTDGFVTLLDSPALENRHEDEWTLWVHPNNDGEGYISGTYPKFTIKDNQHFTAWVGCLDDSKGCNVTFGVKLEIIGTGNVTRLGSWDEVFDGEITKIDVDLSNHAGKDVRFILYVEINGGTPAKANAFWFVPGIVQK